MSQHAGNCCPSWRLGQNLLVGSLTSLQPSTGGHPQVPPYTPRAPGKAGSKWPIQSAPMLRHQPDVCSLVLFWGGHKHCWETPSSRMRVIKTILHLYFHFWKARTPVRSIPWKRPSEPSLTLLPHHFWSISGSRWFSAFRIHPTLSPWAGLLLVSLPEAAVAS